MSDQRIDTGKVALQVRDHERNGDAVIFLHFGGGNLMMWQGVVPFFQEKYYPVLVDLRGHGRSDKPPAGYHIDQMAADVVAVMQHLEVGQAHIVGSSLGAEVGLSLAANHSEKVLSLTCEGALYSEFGPYGLWEGTGEGFQAHAQQTLEALRQKQEPVFPSIDALVADSRHKFEAREWWSDIFESVVRYDAIRIGEGQYTGSWGMMALDYTRYYLFYRFEDYYRRLKCPLLMLPDTYPGQTDREKEVMEGLINLVSRAKITHIPEWVHPFGWMLAPESGSRAVLEFFSEVEAGRI